MTNFELAVALLERDRYARAWEDGTAVRNLLERFGIDPAGVALGKFATDNRAPFEGSVIPPVVVVSEDQPPIVKPVQGMAAT